MSSTPNSSASGPGGAGSPQRPMGRPAPRAVAGLTPGVPLTSNAPASPGPAGKDAAATAPGDPKNNKRNLYISGGIGAAVVLGLIALLVWRPWTPEPPRLNSPVHEIAKFSATSDFEKLPFERQYTYMELLDDKKEGIEQAYEQGQLTDDEFRRALQMAWFGERVGRARNYFSKPPGRERTAYLDKLLDKRDKKKAEGDKSEDPDEDVKPLKASDIGRDDSRQDEQIAAWPAEVQAQWQEFKNAYDQRKEARKARKEAAGTQPGEPAKAPKSPKSGK